jgi:L-fuculose-phosphate aldolase
MATKDEVTSLKRQLLEGIQILMEEGVLGAMGHLSVRIPGTETFLINPRCAPNLAEMEDLSTVDLNTGKRVEGPGPIPGETAIHYGIYRRNPKAVTALHTHPRYTVLMSVLNQPIVPFNNEAQTFSQGVGYYPESHQIDTEERGRALAEAIGEQWVALQRGHGMSAGGVSIPGIVRMAIRLERVCEDQLTLMRLGEGIQRLPDSDQQQTAALGPDYREYPFLQQKHHTRPIKEIKAMTNMPTEGVRSIDRRGQGLSS